MPSVLVYDNEGLKELSTSNISALYEYICVELASNNYTGTITFGNANPIGSFSDTSRQGDIGSTDLTIVSNTYFLSQINTTTLDLTSDAPHVVGLDTSEPGVVVLKESNVTITTIADEVLQHRASFRTGGYHLGNTSPSDGGTWISLGMIEDTLYNVSLNNTSYFLWKKIAGNTATLFRPIKLTGSYLEEFNDTNIQGIIKKIEQRIIDTGVGSYVLQASPPVTGTWASRGTITDVRRIAEESSVDTGYVAESVTYTGDIYTGEVIISTPYTGAPLVDGGPTYVADLNYTSTITDSFASGDLVFNPFVFPYVRNIYTGPNRNFSGYQGNFFADAIWVGPTNFNRYTGIRYWSSSYDIVFGGSVSYTSDIDAVYTGDVAFTAEYTGTPVEYVGGGAPATYTGTTTANVVSASTETITTLTLYERIA